RGEDLREWMARDVLAGVQREELVFADLVARSQQPEEQVDRLDQVRLAAIVRPVDRIEVPERTERHGCGEVLEAFYGEGVQSHLLSPCCSRGRSASGGSPTHVYGRIT